MNEENFENCFLSSLKENDEKCINIIENNESTIKENYDENCSNENLSKFVESINKIIIENEIDFNLFQKVLNHPLFYNIYSKFKSSDILIEACKKEKIDTIYWLVSLNVDVNLTDKNEKSAIMYLVDQGNSKELEFLLSKGANVNFINKNFESALSILLNNMKIKKYDEATINKILDILNKNSCDFNIPIDEYQNTAFMGLLIFDNQPIHIINIAKKNSSIDFSIKNKYGENVSSLLVKLNNNTLLYNLMNNSSFDFSYRDPLSGNSLLMLSAISQPMLLDKLIKMNSFNINELNNNNENALILATKAGCISTVKILLKKKINCNQQDNLGNTALHYAVKLNDPYLVYILNKHIDSNILNNKGLSPKSEAFINSNERVKDVILGGYNIDIEKNDLEIPKIAYKLFKETYEYLSPRVSEESKIFNIEEIIKNASTPYSPVFQDKKKFIAEFIQGFFVPF
ncbi:ankyrin [Neocallimastix lanati (nom. inval.)]|nr:ankyrin [Neocallimastix sp. JGI-2020a]